MKEITNFIKQHDYPPFDLRAVFFDMDGILFDSMPSHAAAWAQTMQNRGFDFSEYDAYLNEGRTGESTINQSYLKYFGHEASQEECNLIYAEKSAYFEACGPVKPIVGTLELLQVIQAQHLDIFVVTGSAQRSLLDNLNAHFPRIFAQEKMVTALDVKFGKPNPEPYLIALEKAQIHPWQAVVVENAPLGVQAAVAAGIFTIAVNTGILTEQVLADAGAHLVYPSMTDLLTQWPTIYGK